MSERIYGSWRSIGLVFNMQKGAVFIFEKKTRQKSAAITDTSRTTMYYNLFW